MKNTKINLRKVTAMTLMLLMLSSAAVLANGNTVNAQTTGIPSDMLQYEWPQCAVDASRSNFNSGPGPTTSNIEWRTEIPYLARPDPVAFSGMVFVQDSPPTGVVSTYALNAATGDIVYKVEGASGSVAKLDDTYMLIGSNCYEIADGSLVWQGPSGFSPSQNQMTGMGYVSELKMVFSSGRGWSLANLAQPPTLLWDRTTEPDYGAYGAETENIYGNGVLVYKTEYNYIVGVDAETGKTQWTTAIPSMGFWSYGASVIDGVLGHGDLNGNFYGWDITTGELLWTYTPGTYYNEWACASGAAYGMFYEKNQDTYLYAINATTGELVWKYKGPGVSYSNSLSIAGGKVYAQTGENQYVDFATGEPGYSEFACLDAFTGEIIWTEPWENNPPNSQQCIAYGKLFIAPTMSTYHPGVHVYGFTEGSLSEIWCVGDTPKDWSMFLSDPENSGVGDGPTNLVLNWKTSTGCILLSPAIVNGVVYAGSFDGNIYAFNANTGEQKWSYATGKIGFSSTPAVANGKLYTGADNGKVYCLNAETGTELWAADVGGIPMPAVSIVGLSAAGSPTVVGDRVYVAAANKLIYCLNADSGAVIWSYNATGDVSATTPTVVDGAVYLGANGGFTEGGFHVIKLNAATGAEIFNVVLPGYVGGTFGSYMSSNIITPVTVGGGIVFARGQYRYNYALNATTGETIWMIDGKYNVGFPGQAQGNKQCAPMLYRGGVVYFQDYYGITAVDAFNGTELWHTYLSRETTSPGLSYSFGRIYTVNEAGALYVLDASTGEKLSYYQFEHTSLKSVPTPYNGSLYVCCADYNLYCFEEAPTTQATGSALPTLTSVSVAPKFQTSGSAVLFEGTVLADSMGTQAGIPVEVHLTAIDPNNNFQDIAVVTSDDAGFFCTTWTPPVPGPYVVTACFEGDQYFMPSTAKAAFVVTEESAAANAVVSPTPIPETPTSAVPTPTPVQSVSPSPLPSEAPQPSTSAVTPIWTYAAIAAAVIVILAAAAVLALRKHT
ncbi:MAG: PQQ-binding-like beta-propeller repeat protein [Candidatus Bathyarchaeota archaeon]|nr:PQQ-binding-like beta-propeller repeat protein [Candidatus Bathyarchaeota archaeon]